MGRPAILCPKVVRSPSKRLVEGRDKRNRLVVIHRLRRQDVLSEEQKKRAISSLASAFGIAVDLRDQFEFAMLNRAEEFTAEQAMAMLPDEPLREYKPRENILRYIEEAFAPWIEADALTRPLIREKSPRAYMALANWLRNNELPANFPINSQAVSHSPVQMDETNIQAIRDARAAYERQRYAARKLENNV